MKKFLLTAATAAAALTTLSADQFYVIMKDGSVESYPTEKVDSISFNDPQIAKIMGFNEMAAELIKLKERVAALEAKSGVIDTSATSNASDLKYFVLNNKEVEVAGIINGSADLVIPETGLVNGKIYTVTSIGSEAFKNQDRIKTVLLPKTITSIRDLAFYGCESLESIEIPSSVTSIGDYAFDGCGLKSINIQSGVTSIGEGAFSGCELLAKITIPSSVTSIGGGAFEACKNLDLVIDNSRSNVECDRYSFDEVKSVTFTGSPFLFRVLENGEGVELVNEYEDRVNPLYNSLGSIKIPSEVEIKGKKYPVTSIGSMAFYDCRSLTSIEIPSSVTSIGRYAFKDCGNLDVVVDNSAYNMEVNGGTFWDVKSVKFTGCPLIFRVSEDDKSAEVTYDGPQLTGPIYKNLDKVTIPSEVEIKGKKYSVTSIGDDAFYDCSSLTSIEIPSSVTSIGNSAFYGCSSLTSVEIPSSVTSIGGAAFVNCSSLTKLEIPSSVTSIGGDEFYGCENLDVVIDNSEGNVKFDNTTFEGCKSVTFKGNSNSSADVDSNAQIQIELGGSYKATNEQLGEFSFYVQSASGTYQAQNRVVVLKDYATKKLIELSDEGNGYLMLDGDQVVAVKNTTARNNAKYIIAGLQYGDVENDYTIISASENATLKSLGATKTTFERTK